MKYPFLRNVPLFADLSEEDLELLCDMSQEVLLQDGERLFEEGDPGDRAYIISRGGLEIVKVSSGRDVLLAVHGPGSVIGELALLHEAPRMAGARARGETVLLAITKAQLEHLIRESASAARGMFNTVIERLRSTTAILQQSEKMAQLGTLAAGIAHELNNPAAAVRRGAGQLDGALEKLVEAQAALNASALSDDRQRVVEQWREQIRNLAKRPPDTDPLERSDREAELEEWLDDHDVPDAWELASTLVDVQVDPESLGKLLAQFGADTLATLIRWMTASFSAHTLLAEIGQGAERLSGIVKALKSYSYLDQAPLQEVDLHEGLDNTLIILRSKLKSGITVIREYGADVPRIQAFGSELNQVWTNLIDNAADALDGQGTITIRTRREDPWIVVEIQDNGPGIPEAIRSKIFDAFYTTKPPGKGTGLGLHISYNIVAQKHQGEIELVSVPAGTCFRVRLPQDLAGAATRSTARTVLPNEERIKRILSEAKTVAVVGITAVEDRPSFQVPQYLQRHGYRILPVNPKLTEVLGERAYASLDEVEESVDVVDIFRRSEAVPEIVDAAIRKGVKVVWMQEGVVNEEAARKARDAGIDVVMDQCMRAAHRRLLR